ncbi:MAG: DUF1015 domain-containing protein [Bacteroidia bacterium]|nr:DUF1015 domain-containing protein [Bacteroidia bacterium]
MAIVLPFKGIRPCFDKAHLVASRPVDSYTRDDLKEKLAGNPFTFLHVIHPDYKDGTRTTPGSPERLRKTKERFTDFMNEGILLQDKKEAYYLYRQIKGLHEYTGLIARTCIDDYFTGVIRVHEATLTDREQKLMEYLDVCDFNAEPVLFFYPDDKAVNRLIARQMRFRAEFDFTTTDKVRHTLWIIRDPAVVKKIRDRFGKTKKIYIADGHHRSASSALLGKRKRERKGTYTGKEPWNFYLGIFLSESQLKVYDYNRVVRDLNEWKEEDFIRALSLDFDIVTRKSFFSPKVKHQLGMYLAGKWYRLTLKRERWSKGPVESLDSEILTRRILEPLLEIRDLKTDPRIGFVSGVRGMEGLEKIVDSGEFTLAFSLCPVKLEDVKLIADTNNIMPPKTTWVEPKMRSGLVIYPISEQEK